MQHILKSTKAARNTIQIYAYYNKKAKRTKFKNIKGVTIEGNFSYANRIISGNGNLVHDQQEFDSAQAAKKNLTSLKRICALMV